MSPRPSAALRPWLAAPALALLGGCIGLDVPGSTPEGAAPLDGSLGSPPPRPPSPDFGGDTGQPDDTTGGDSGNVVDTGEPHVEDGPNPLAGLRLWVDPDSNAAAEAASDPSNADLWRKIADQPVAKWLGGWNTDVEADVRAAVDAGAADGAIRVFVVYNLPNRDCGGYSSGGASDPAAYDAWIDAIAAGLGGRPAIAVLEPDGLSMVDCLSSSDADARYANLVRATQVLKAAGAFVYLDAGHPAWHPADVMAERLNAAQVADADGFALNTSNFETTADLLAYGDTISSLTGEARFIADVGRNGLGPTSDHAWCNPDGRALGEPPTLTPDDPLADALLWVKQPGESDGSCNGGPSAGTWWPEYALGLAQRATW